LLVNHTMSNIIRTHPKDPLTAIAGNAGLFVEYVRRHPDFHAVLLQRGVRAYAYTEIFNNVVQSREILESIWRYGHRGGPIKACLEQGMSGSITYRGDGNRDCTKNVEDILKKFPTIRADFELATRTLWNDQTSAVQFQLLSHHDKFSDYPDDIVSKLHYDDTDTIHIHVGGAGMEVSNLDLRNMTNLNTFGSTALPDDLANSLTNDNYFSLNSGDFFYFRGSDSGNPNAHRKTSLEKIVETKGRLAIAAYPILKIN
jgi:hypothetical protein